MHYEWDPAKATSNARKHGVRFADAVAVFADEEALTTDDPHPDEEPYVTIGTDALGQVIVVVYTWRGDRTICLISARRAARNEQRHYAGGGR